MNLLSHAFFGLALASCLGLDAVYTTIGAVLPDIDYLINVSHRTATHSLLFWLIISSIAFAKNRKKGMSISLGMLSHLLLDSITTQGIGLLWPLNEMFGFFLFNSMGKTPNLIVILVCLTLILNSSKLSHSLKSHGIAKAHILFLIALLFSIPFTIFTDSQCSAVAINHMLDNSEEYEGRCVIVDGYLCSNITSYQAKSGAIYNMFYLCNGSSRILIFSSSEYRINPASSSMRVKGIFTTRYREREINRIKDIIYK